MNNDGIQIRLGDILHVVWKRRKNILLCTVLGLVLGLMLFGFNYLQGEMSSEYTITASVSISTQRKDGTFTNGSYGPSDDDYTLAQDLKDGTVYLMKSSRVLSEVIEKRQLIGLTIKDIQKNLTIEQEEKAPVLNLSLSWRSVDEGIAILNSLVAVTEEAMLDAYYVGKLTIIDQPESAMWSLGAKIGASVWALLAVIGFLIGLAMAVMELLLHPTLLNIKDVRTMFEMETLAVIPKDEEAFRFEDSILTSMEQSVSQVKENYTAAAHILHNRLRKRKGCQCFYVTSAASGEGKTVAAANLAIELANLEYKVLLIDLNLRNPGIGGLFMKNVDYNYSLNSYYRGECSLEDAIRPLTGYLDILPTVLEHNELALDKTMFDLINSLKSKYDYIILDTLSVGESSDVLRLNAVVENAVYVVRYDYAAISDIQESLDRMDKSGIHIIGCIVNAYSALHTERIVKHTNNTEDILYKPNSTTRTDFFQTTQSDDDQLGNYEVDESDTTDSLISGLLQANEEEKSDLEEMDVSEETEMAEDTEKQE